MKKPDLGTSVAIIGTGRVGTALAFTLILQGTANRIVLIGHDKEKAEGEAMDLGHGGMFTNSTSIHAGSYSDLKDIDIIVITAGTSNRGSGSRLELLEANYQILKDILSKTTKYNKKARYILISNPVDVLTYATLKLTGLPKNQVFGSGTTLDSSRFRYLLAKKLKVSSHNVHAYILGEHGDSEFPVLSSASIGGVPLLKFPGITTALLKDAYIHTQKAGSEVIKKKGSTFWAIATMAAGIIQRMKYDNHTIMPISTLLSGEYGLKNVCLSVPCRIGAVGVENILEIPMSKKELSQLKNSADILKKAIKSIKL